MPTIEPPEEPMDIEQIKAALKRLANELPIIAVGFWALLRVVGFDIDEGTAAGIVTGVESVVAVAIALLVRRTTDGPVTAYKGQRAPYPSGSEVRAEDLPRFDHFPDEQ